jgi:hypothetical protein
MVTTDVSKWLYMSRAPAKGINGVELFTRTNEATIKFTYVRFEVFTAVTMKFSRHKE